VLSDVSEERIASIFRVKEKIRKFVSEEPVWAGANRHYICSHRFFACEFPPFFFHPEDGGGMFLRNVV
jgi:hypothetical protein